MKTKLIQSIAVAAMAILGIHTASAHIGYTGRNFGSFSASGFENAITLNATTQLFGWADGTDADFGDSHKTRAFRFNLQSQGYITLTVQATGDGNPFLPAFSVFSGLAHVSPDPGDHDFSLATQSYFLTNYGNYIYDATHLTGTFDGAYRSLNDWLIHNDNGDASFFTYKGNAADGDSTNYGAAAEINGDGVANGFVSSSFLLPAGDYSVFIGGASYSANQTTTAGFSATLQVVPEPSLFLLLLLGMPVLFLLRRRAQCAS